MYQTSAGSTNIFSNLSFAKIAWAKGEYERAESLYMEFHEQLDLLGERGWKMEVTRLLGILAQEQGDLEQAKSLFEEALTISRELNNLVFIAFCLVELSNPHYLEGDREKGKSYLVEGVQITKSLPESPKMAFLLYGLNSIRMHDPKSAAILLGILDSMGKTKIHPIPPGHRHEYDRTDVYTREILGNEAFGSAYAQGQKMSLDDGLNLVLKVAEAIK